MPQGVQEPEAAGHGDTESGTVYVLRSRSEHPFIAANRNLVHKIGVSEAERLEDRFAGAEDSPTVLFAEVEVVRSWRLFNINRSRLERLLHRVFAPGRLAVDIADRFGRPVQPREWFLAPLPVIEEAVERLRNGSIPDFGYDAGTASLIRKTGTKIGAGHVRPYERFRTTLADMPGMTPM